MSRFPEILAGLSTEQLDLLLLRLGRTASQIPPPIIPHQQDRGSFPLSSGQRRLWLVDQLVSNGALLNVAHGLRFRGSLDCISLQQSINEIVRRHEILRTRFITTNGEPVQVVEPAGAAELQMVDAQATSAAQRLVASSRAGLSVGCFKEIVSGTPDAGYRFNLNCLPLVRATLFRLARDYHVLLMTMHHIVTDGWSMGIFFSELLSIYQAFSTRQPSPLNELPVQYGDYACWQQESLRHQELDRLLAFWRTAVAGAVFTLPLPVDRPYPPTRSWSGGQCGRVLPSATADRLRSLSVKEGTTMYVTLLAAFLVLLHRYTQQDEIVIGTPVSNRTRPELMELIGFFTNTLVLRADLSGEPTFLDLLHRVHNTVHAAFAHQDLPFDCLVEALNPPRNENRNPLFQVEYAFQPTPASSVILPHLLVDPIPFQNPTEEFDLSLNVIDDKEGLALVLEYNTDIFDESTAERALGHLEVLAADIAADPSHCLHYLSLLTDRERHQLVVERHDPVTDVSDPVCIHDVFQLQVERTPDAIAVLDSDTSVTYRDLDARSSQLAGRLRFLGVRPERLVGLCLDRSSAVVVAALGVLKAGGAFLPLDPDYPRDRLAFMLDDAKPDVIITDREHSVWLPASNQPVLLLDDSVQLGMCHPAENYNDEPDSDNLAYVVYTSGSTGKPKGVMVTHGNLVSAYVGWDKAYNLRSTTCRHLQTASICFDVFAGDLVRALCFGPTLVFCPRETILAPAKLFRFMLDHQIDYAELTPSVWRVLLAHLESEHHTLGFMRLAIVGSDAWSVNDHKLLAKYCGPDTRVINSYGVTEATVDSLYYDWRPASDDSTPNQPCPIGRPFERTTVYLLDNDLQAVPKGVPGELYIGGPGVARGYLNRDELTATRFIRDPIDKRADKRVYRTGDRARYLSDGTIQFLGRNDNQVKIRGFRVEPDEVALVLQEHPAVRQALVVPREDVQGQPRLVAYIIAKEGFDVPSEELKASLKRRLPAFMMPASFNVLAELPLTPNGKVDYHALPDPKEPGSHASFIPPTREVEVKIAAIWQELLGIDHVGIFDNFFDIGGHSLLAAQLSLRLGEEFQVDISLRDLFESATIASLAELVQSDHRDLQARDSAESIESLRKDVFLNIASVSTGASLGADTSDSILLTGATGFVGGHMLCDLLHQSSAQVFCLVRANNIAEGMRRIRQNLDAYSIWDESLAARIVPLIGDLARPQLGIPSSSLQSVCDEVGGIYHCGYWVNFLYPYQMLRGANVQGTRELLQLATRGKPKAVHFMSTIGVFSGYPEGATVSEDDTLETGALPVGGYSQTKWVAEQLVRLVRSRGIHANVFRPGFVGGHSRKGVCNPRDLLWRMVKGCVELGTAPEMNFLVDLSPVDYVTGAMLQLSRRSRPPGAAFHLFNPQAISWAAFVESLVSFGYSLRQEPFLEWRERAAKMGSESTLGPFLPIFQEHRSGEKVFAPEQSARFSCQRTLCELAGTSVECPPVSELLALYLDSFVRTRFLPAPPSHRRSIRAVYRTGYASRLGSQRRSRSGGLRDASGFGSATGMIESLNARQVSSVELLVEHTRRIKEFNPVINAIVGLNVAEARLAAEEADAARARGDKRRLLGLPVTFKESLDVKGFVSSAGLPEFSGHRATEDGLLARRIRAAGALIIGKTNTARGLDDWQTDNPVYGRTKNPWDVSRTPGGSGGGGASALAAGLTPLEFGSEFLGSIRIPAAFCGVYGHKPSESAAPRSSQIPSPGLFNQAVIMSVQGPLARYAVDLILAFDTMAGPEADEAIAWRLRIPRARHKRLRDFRVAVLPTISWLPVDGEVLEAQSDLVSALGRLGARVRETQPEELGDLRHYYSLTTKLVAALRQGHSIERHPTRVGNASLHPSDMFRAAWEEGSTAGVSDYLAWMAQRERYRIAFRTFFRDWDVLLAPIVLCPAFRHCSGTSIVPSDDNWIEVSSSRVPYAWQAVYPSLASLCGLPATSFPIGTSRDRLPIGLQAIGPYLEDYTPLLFVMRLAEEVGGFHPPPGFA